MRRFQTIVLSALLALVTLTAVLPGPSGAQPAGWSASERIGDVAGEYGYPFETSVAVAPDGRALAAWSQWIPDTGFFGIHFRFYSPEGGWGDGGVIDDYQGADVMEPDVATGPNGDFFLVASQRAGGSGVAVLAFRYDAAANLLQSVRSPDGGSLVSVQAPQVALDGSGNALVVWQENDGAQVNVTARWYMPGTGWTASPFIIDTLSLPVGKPSVVVDGGGRATVTWLQDDGVASSVFTRPYALPGGWGPVAALDTLNTRAQDNALAIDAAGNVMAMWAQQNGTNFAIMARRAPSGGAWDPEVQVSPSGGMNAERVRVAGGPAGAFGASWRLWNGVATQTIASVFGPAGWSAPTNLSGQADGGDGAGLEGFPALDAAGRGFVVWDQYHVSHDHQIYGAWWLPGAGWTLPEKISDGTGLAQYVRAASMNAAGRAVVVSYKEGGFTNFAYAQTYVQPDTTPPALAVASPLDGAVTNVSTVAVCADTEAGLTRASVNGMAAQVDGSGAFCVDVPLRPGNNTLEITATDPSGNVATVSRLVVYIDPVPALEAQVAAAQAAAEAAQADADAAAAEAEEARTVALAAEADLAATQADLAAAKQALESARNQVNTTQESQEAMQAAQERAAASNTASITSASSAAAMASLVGLLGIMVGLAGAAMALLAMRKGASGPAAPGPATAAEPPRKEEPPKAP